MYGNLAGPPLCIRSYIYDLLHVLLLSTRVCSMTYDMLEARRAWTALPTKWVGLSPAMKLLWIFNEAERWCTWWDDLLSTQDLNGLKEPRGRPSNRWQRRKNASELMVEHWILRLVDGVIVDSSQINELWESEVTKKGWLRIINGNAMGSWWTQSYAQCLNDFMVMRPKKDQDTILFISAPNILHLELTCLWDLIGAFTGKY